MCLTIPHGFLKYNTRAAELTKSMVISELLENIFFPKHSLSHADGPTQCNQELLSQLKGNAPDILVVSLEAMEN